MAIGTDTMGLVNNDVISQHIGDTVREIANWHEVDYSATIIVHQQALRMLCSELVFCWSKIKELENK